MTSVAVVGASGIGAVHVRELLNAGVRIGSVLGSTPDSSKATARSLSERFGVELPAAPDLRSLLASDVEGVVLATPAETHAELLLAALAAGKHVLCEKPLAWPPPGATGDGEDFLARLAELGEDRLALNTCTAFLLEPALRELELPEKPKRFRFEFFTQGNKNGVAVGVDLLPHALSLLQRLEPAADLRGIELKVREREFLCRLQCGNLQGEFVLRQDPAGPKRLAFGLDDVTVVRDAGVHEGRYRIKLFRDDARDRPVAVPDPFASAALDFQRGISGGAPFAHGFAFAAQNFRWMRNVLAS